MYLELDFNKTENSNKRTMRCDGVFGTGLVSKFFYIVGDNA